MTARSLSEPDRSVLALVRLEAATLLSGAGNSAALVLFPWIVLELTGSAGSAGLLAAATAVPLLAASLLSGTVVDRVGRRRTSVVSDVLSAVSVASVPLLSSATDLTLGLLITLAVIGAVFDPAGVTARETMLPAAADRAGWPLSRANGVHEAVWGVAFLLGPGIAGVLIVWIGALSALWFTAGAFVISALLVATLRLDPSQPDQQPAEAGFWTATSEGLRFVWADRLLRSMTILTAILVSVYMPVEGVLLPVEFESRDEPQRLGIVVMAMSVGGVAGALAYAGTAGRFKRSLVFKASLILAGCFLLVLATLPPFAVMVMAAVLFGFAYGPVGPLVNLAMQTRTPEELRGRVVGVVTSAEYAAGPFGYLIVGIAAQRFGVQPTLLAVAATMLVVAVAGLLMGALRELDLLPEDAVQRVERPDSIDTSGAEATVDAAINVATSGPLPLVLPPRDPESARTDES
ncbi:MAG: MFS transporter [Microthrixaceae bacterium]